MSIQPTPLEFKYYSGLGNFFLITHLPSSDFLLLSPSTIATIIAKECTSRVDGVIFIDIKESGAPHIKMHYFNLDGSRAMMCGNGLRSSIKYAYDHMNFSPHNIAIETDCGIRTGSVLLDSQNQVEVEMGAYSLPASIEKKSVTLSSESSHLIELLCINTGVPHAVTFTNDIKEAQVVPIGRNIRYHSLFHPQGTNVNFVEVVSTNLEKSTIHIRTYERGVEDETGACGTGAAAASLALIQSYFMPISPDFFHEIEISFFSGEKGVCCCTATKPYITISMRGSAIWHPEKAVRAYFYRR